LPKLTLYSKEISNANILEVQVGTNCPQGGDHGHGGRTLFRLINHASTSMQCRINDATLADADKIEIILGGDAEHETFIKALEFALSVLRSQSGINRFSSSEEDVS
jgi:hypothetical protein